MTVVREAIFDLNIFTLKVKGGKGKTGRTLFRCDDTLSVPSEEEATTPGVGVGVGGGRRRERDAQIHS